MKNTLRVTTALVVTGLAAAFTPPEVTVLGPAPASAQIERVYHPCISERTLPYSNPATARMSR